jgi:hypothetical protein
MVTMTSDSDASCKLEATLIAQTYLEAQKQAGKFTGDPIAVAAGLVTIAWTAKAHFIRARSAGKRPHKAAIAALALAYGIDAMAKQDMKRTGAVLALAELLAKVKEDHAQFGFHNLDELILAEARHTIRGVLDLVT